MPRKPYQIAFDIRHEMHSHMLGANGKARSIPSWITTAKPYVQALLQLTSLDEYYGLEDGRMIAAYALNNLASWRGERARALKAELKELLDN